MWYSLAIVSVLASVGAMSAKASANVVDLPFASALGVSDSELDVQRGGFSLGGLDIQLGAQVSSYIGDALVMQTNVTWSAKGATSQTFYTAALVPADAKAMLGGSGSNAGLSLNLGTAKVFLGNQGKTAFIQRTDGTIQNVIINTASNVALRQQVNVQIYLSNYASFSNELIASRLGTTAMMLNGGLIFR